MNDISITEAYFVYSVRGKGKLSGNDCRKVTGLLTAALWEMTQNGLLTLTDNRLCLNDVDHFTRSWFQPLYEHIRENGIKRPLLTSAGLLQQLVRPTSECTFQRNRTCA